MLYYRILMRKYSNKKVRLGNRQYEIFWVTDYVVHIFKRESHESHQINIQEIEEFASKAIFVLYREREGMYAGLGRFKGKFYNVLGYFRDTPKRFVPKTCHRVTDNFLLNLCKELGI